MGSIACQFTKYRPLLKYPRWRKEPYAAGRDRNKIYKKQ